MSQIDQDRDVSVLPWPVEAGERERLARLRMPRLWVVEEGGQPPPDLDDLEDWVRTPYADDELVTRVETLRTRVVGPTRPPVLDDEGILRHRGRWVAIPDAQIPVVALLVERLGRLVRIDELLTAYAAAGGTITERSMHMVVGRLRNRIGDLGLSLHVVRCRGVILDRSRV